MHLIQSMRLDGRTLIALGAVVCLAVAGCSTPMRPGLANFQEKREIDKLANDSSFPLAAEVGLASSDVSKKKDDG
jgi:hypothetical protein